MKLVVRLIIGSLLLAVALPVRGGAQTVMQQPSQTLTISRGSSVLLVSDTPIQRFTIGDPAIAEVAVLSPSEILINGTGLGSTTLILWEAGTGPKLYSVEVTVDTPALERYLQEALPGERITVTASGQSVTLSGNVQDPVAVDRAVEIAQGTGVQSVINNLVAPPAVQVLLQVRFAEVNRSNLKDFSAALASLNPQDLDSEGDWTVSTLSEGLIRIFLQNPNADIEGIINASITKGTLRSLAEPNLLTLPGREASFLAGGEFPYPTIQTVTAGAGAQGAVTITYREFGVRLRFTPEITRSGSIRLSVEPEVSTLDFANGLTISGFEIPSLLVRRAKTEVELREGQYLALAGLIDNSTLENVTKIPILGDIPILGAFFRSTQTRARQTELLVLVSPRLVRAGNTAPPLPTGEPATWNWPGWLRQAVPGQRERVQMIPPGGEVVPPSL